MKTRDLRQMTTEELQQELTNHQKELYNLRHQGVVEQLENPAQLRKSRRAIAQILTLLRERELQMPRGEQPSEQKVEAKS
jgi:large subunit ribosomal protein L29